MKTLNYHNFSIKGDRRWSETSRVTGYAPFVVFAIFILSLVQVSLGSVWLVSLKTITVPAIIQTLLLPGCGFFNGLTSLHVHLLLRRNPPTMALWFGCIFASCWLASSILMLVSCTGRLKGSQGLRNLECPTDVAGVTKGASKAVWGLVVALGLISAALYGVHAAMAYYVKLIMKKQPGIGDSVEMDAQQAQKARDRWARLARIGYL